nr:unnamed protein product [Callosobruchus chinensis]
MEKHWQRCGLLHREEEVLHMYVNSGMLINFRRSALRFVLLSTKHPFSKLYYRSYTQRRREHIRHLSQYRRKVHPFSMFNVYWEYLISSMYVADCALLTIRAMSSWGVPPAEGMTEFMTAFDCMFIIDMLLRFFVGYYDYERNKTVLNWQDITIRYLKSYFAIDFLACSNTLFYALRYISEPIRRFQTWLVFFPVFRIIRMPRVLDAFDIFKARLALTTFKATLFKACLAFTIMLMFSYCMLFTAEDAIENVFYQTMRYETFSINRVYMATLQVLAVNVFDRIEGAQLVAEMASIIFLIYGFWMNVLTLIIIFHMWKKLKQSRSEEASLEFKQYVRHQGMSSELRTKFYMFLRYKFRNTFFKENEINKTVSTILRRELHMSITSKTIERKMKRVHHWRKCGLQPPEEPVVNSFIDSGMFIEARRRFFSFIMLSSGHPHAKIYYRSHLQRRREHLRQMSRYSSTIHPFSKCNIYWEYIISCALMIDGIYRIILATYSWGVESTIVLRRSIMVMDLLLLCDIVMRFFTGYYDSEANKTVLEKKTIAKSYLKTYFLIDLIASGYTTLFFVRAVAIRNMHEWTVVLGIIRIVRVPRIFAAFEVFRLRSSVSGFATMAVTTLLALWVLTTFSYVLIFTVENIIEFVFYETTRWEQLNVFRLYKSTILLWSVGVEGSVEGAQLSFQVSSIFFLCWGIWINMLTLICITNLWTTSGYGRSKDLVYLELNQYVRSAGLPQDLRAKFFAFLRFKFNNRFYKENAVNKTANVPHRLLNALVAKFRTEIFLTNDVIFVAGVPGDCMYFINYGTVAIYSLTGKEICHLEDGAHFGEISMIFNEPRVETVVAVTPCELFILHKADFMEIISPYRRILEMIKEQARSGISDASKENRELELLKNSSF